MFHPGQTFCSVYRSTWGRFFLNAGREFHVKIARRRCQRLKFIYRVSIHQMRERRSVEGGAHRLKNGKQAQALPHLPGTF